MSQPSTTPHTFVSRRSSSVRAVVLGGAALLGFCAIVVAATGGFSGRRKGPDDVRRAGCAGNVKQLGLALQMYALDFDDRLPAAATWETAGAPYHKNARLNACPSDPAHGQSYAFNSAVGGRSLKLLADPEAAPVLFDSTLHAANGHDPLRSWVPRHRRARKPVGLAGFADGHVKALPTAPSAHAGSAQGR